MSLRRLGATGLVLLLAALPQSASAHLVGGQLGPFYSGLLHPLTALEHIIPWLAIGLLAGWQGPRTGRWTLRLFSAAVLASTLAAGWAAAELPSGLVNLASFVVLGGLLALAWPLPLAVSAVLALLFGLSHGYANGLAAPTGEPVSLFAAGVGASAYLVVALTAAGTVVIARHQGWPCIALRAAGSWIAAIGIMMLGLRLAGVDSLQ